MFFLNEEDDRIFNIDQYHSIDIYTIDGRKCVIGLPSTGQYDVFLRGTEEECKTFIYTLAERLDAQSYRPAETQDGTDLSHFHSPFPLKVDKPVPTALYELYKEHEVVACMDSLEKAQAAVTDILSDAEQQVYKIEWLNDYVCRVWGADWFGFHIKKREAILECGRIVDAPEPPSIEHEIHGAVNPLDPEEYESDSNYKSISLGPDRKSVIGIKHDGEEHIMYEGTHEDCVQYIDREREFGGPVIWEGFDPQEPEGDEEGHPPC